MSGATAYLKEYASIADRRLGEVQDMVWRYYRFFRDLIQPDRLANATWSDIQRMGDHIHSLSGNALAKARAFGKPNHPIEHYRRSLEYLARGAAPVEERITRFLEDPQYKLSYIGNSVTSELLGHFLSDEFIFYNRRDRTALRILGIDPGFDRGDSFAQKFVKYNAAAKPIMREYEEVVGRRTELPLSMEVDQFFSWIFEEYAEGDEEDDPADSDEAPAGTSAGTTPDLRSAAVLQGLWEACESSLDADTETVEWRQELISFLGQVQDSGEEERGTLEFQKRLWDDNPVSAVGQGNISVDACLKDAAFRTWLAAQSMEKLGSGTERVAWLEKLHLELIERVRPHARLLPHLKIGRVLAALFPQDFTCVTHTPRLTVLHRAMFGEKGSGVVAQHANILRRLGEVLGPPESTPAGLAGRMTFAWRLYEVADGQRDAKGQLASEPTHLGLESAPLVPRVGENAPQAPAYWWLNANPKIWNFEQMPVGGRETYTSHNESGNKRQKYKYFQEAVPGDLVLGYVTSPQKEVVAICRITKGLHEADEGEGIEFEKLEQLEKPISYESLQANPDLATCEPVVSNQGSLFKVTEQEYEIIRSLIDDANVRSMPSVEQYDRQKARNGLFLSAEQFDEALDALNEKKNVVLQGAPGVGKTYIARRLAYALVGSDDPRRIEMIQFHQSYSYEDFIQGFRPTPKGHFDLKPGLFYQFCRRAQREEAAGTPYVFIIDEINRGNLSKIFGELLMLIEPDKRGKEFAIPLAYSQDPEEKFYIPANLHLIGMMNTADRSLALVDYALRRRFRFITLKPEFRSRGFQSFLIASGASRELAKKVIDRLTALNEVIAADTKDLGRGYQVGHSYFCPRNGIKPDERWYRRVVESEILPLIREYWFDNEQKVDDQRAALLA